MPKKSNKNIWIIGFVLLVLFISLFKMTNHTLFQAVQDYQLQPIEECSSYNSCYSYLQEQGFPEDKIDEALVCKEDGCYIKVKIEKQEVATNE